MNCGFGARRLFAIAPVGSAGRLAPRPPWSPSHEHDHPPPQPAARRPGPGRLAREPGARACEFFSTHLRIFHPWTRATAEGDTFAVLCMSFDEVRASDRLIRVESPVATHAELSGAAAGARPRSGRRRWPGRPCCSSRRRWRSWTCPPAGTWSAIATVRWPPSAWSRTPRLWCACTSTTASRRARVRRGWSTRARGCCPCCCTRPRGGRCSPGWAPA